MRYFKTLSNNYRLILSMGMLAGLLWINYELRDTQAEDISQSVAHNNQVETDFEFNKGK